MTTTLPDSVPCTALLAVNPLQSCDLGFREVYRTNCTLLKAPWDTDPGYLLRDTVAGR